MWFSWDFSYQTISVTHQAIPYSCPSISCSSGSSGSSGITVVVPSCTTAPSAPQLSIDWTTQGTRFTLKPAASGATASTIYYNYAYFDSATVTWEKWSSWYPVSGTSQSIYVADPIAGKSKIAFSSYATNACGTSDFARENTSKNGVVFSTSIKDEIMIDSTRLSYQVDSLPISLVIAISSKQSMALSFSSTTQEICSVSSSLLSLLKPGICKVIVTSGSLNNISSADSKVVEFQILKADNQITLTIPKSIIGSTSITLIPKVLSSNGFSIESNTPSVCSVKENKVVPLTTGNCGFNVTALEDSKYLEGKKAFSLTIEKAANSLEWTIPNVNLVDSVLQISPDFKFGADFEASNSTPEVCQLSEQISVKLLKGGYCIIDIKAKDSPLVSAATKQFIIKVSKLQNEMTVEYATSLLAGDPLTVTPKLKYLTDFSFSVKDNFYCSIIDGLLTGNNEGNCSITLKVYETDKYLGFTKAFDISIQKKDQQIKLSQLSFFLENSKGPISLQASSSSGLSLLLRSLTPLVCNSQGTQIIGVKTGECRFSLEQAGNNEYKAAEAKFISGQVFMDKITITCAKGKVKKMVTAVRPVCPKGYKRK